MRVLLTGGAGYIGSHVALVLARAGHDVTILDNFSNASPVAFSRMVALAGSDAATRLGMVRLDIRDTPGCTRLLRKIQPGAVIHLAGLKDVAQSMREPVRYFEVNLRGTMSLLAAMQTVGCERLVFSSSAAIYGYPQYLPIDEQHPCFPGSPYGHSKFGAELMIRKWVASGSRRRALALRYFNPVGCEYDPSNGLSLSAGGDALMNRFVAVASGQVRHLRVFGSDYDTPDGTALRDFVHVADLAGAHVAALKTLDECIAGFLPVNLGTGRAMTVLQMAAIFQDVTGRKLPMIMAPRREGDIASSWAAVGRASDLLGWRVHRTCQQMCQSAWSARNYDLSAEPDALRT